MAWFLRRQRITTSLHADFTCVLAFMTACVGLSLGALEQAANGAAVVTCGIAVEDFIIPKLLSKNDKTKNRHASCPIIDACNHVGINELKMKQIQQHYL